MPCCLFTYHAYGTWLPDRKQGFVRRKLGILAPDPVMAAQYRAAMKEPIAEFESEIQSSIIDSILESRDKQHFEVYYIATDTTHVHAILAWRDERKWLHMRSIIKSSISRRLKQDCGARAWLSEGASRKRVKDRSHFDYLVSQYLPKHRGWKWNPEAGKFL